MVDGACGAESEQGSMEGRSRRDRALLFDWGDTLMRVYPEYDGPMCDWPRVAAMPDAARVLTDLREDWRLALATNAADSDVSQIQAALGRVGLADLLERIYCYRSTGVRKPSKAFFEHILADLGLPASRVVMVGDDYEADALGALAVGIRALWLNRKGGPRHEGDGLYTISRLAELPQALNDPIGARPR
jgi:putative hydrolase of the HAD superfamily